MGSRSVIDLLLFMLEQNGRILLYVGSEISPNVLECGYVSNVKNEFFTCKFVSTDPNLQVTERHGD